MKLLIGPLASGKTTRLIQWMREAPEGEKRVAVFSSMQEVSRLQRENPDVESWRFLSFDDIEALRGYDRDIVVGIDNLSWFLSRALGGRFPAGLVTFTGQVEQIKLP